MMKVTDPLNESGYQVVEDVISAQECKGLLEAMSPMAGSRRRAGARHLMTTPEVAAVARDPRMLRIAGVALGKAAQPFRATLFEKTGLRNWLVVWHQDTALPLKASFAAVGWGPWSKKLGVPYAHAPTWALERIVALRLHLDESTSENGPLRVIVGSHRLGVLPDEGVSRAVQTGEATECLVPRGGVLAMRPLLIHSSSKALRDCPRRVLHIEYADSLKLADGIQLAVV